MPEHDDRKAGVLLADARRELQDALLGGTQTARPEPAELSVLPRPLCDAGLPVSEVIDGVDGESSSGERPGKRVVSECVLADTVSDLHHRDRLFRRPLVREELDAVRIGQGELAVRVTRAVAGITLVRRP